MADFVAKPTNKKPVTSHGEKYEKDFKNKTTMHGLNLNEVDGFLNEKEMSLKKKIFSLPKMEALVHPDPKLSAVYNKMAEEGEEKFGYHYNETIMNIIFNDYVLNSPKYLQKYKMAVPKKKKRRDKSGIRQMQKDAEKKIEQSKKMDAEKGITENVGGIRVKFLVHPDDPDVFAYFPDENHDASGKYKMGYSHIGQHSAVDPQYAAESRPATPEEYDELKNELEQHVGYTLDIMDENFSNGKPAMGKEPAVHGGEVIDTGSSERRDSQDNKLKNAKVKSVLSPDDIEETTSAGGAGIGASDSRPSGNAGDYGFIGPFRKGDVNRRPIFPGGTVIQESNYLVDTTGFEKYYNSLNETIDLNVNEIVDDVLKEESKSKAQQRFMGMVRGVQKGDVNPKDVSNKVRKTAKDMKQSDVKDFAKTKHDKLPEKINENMNKISTPEELKAFVADKKARTGRGLSKDDIPMLAGQALYNVAVNTANRMLPMPWEHLPDINSMWDYIDKNGGMTYENFLESVKEAVNDRLEEDGFSLDDLMENKVNEHHLSSDEDKVMYIIKANDIINPDKAFDSGTIPYVKSHFMSLGSEQIDALYKTSEKLLQQKGVDPMSIDINEETDQTMIGANPESIANKPRPEGEFGGGVPMGMQDSGGLREELDVEDDIDLDVDINKDAHKMDWKRIKDKDAKPVEKDKFTNPIDGREMFEEINEELKAFEIHQDKLKSIMEDKKPSSLVMKDRLGKDNESNFKKDMKGSVTKDVVKMEKDMAWKEQQEDVSKNPYKAGEDLEKAAIKATKGNALKNVGNSDGTKGEIPKRNLTTKEQEEVDLYRGGVHKLTDFDNEPDQKYVDRMKDGMGDDMFKQREDYLKDKKNKRMYAKDTQPVENTKSLKEEAIITGRYINDLGKKKFIDFQLNKVSIVETINNMVKLDFTGMGNIYDSRGNINESVNNVLTTHVFYTNGKKVVAIKNPVKKLNEVEKKKKPIVNEEYNKMKHLLGYDPKTYVDSKRNKI